MKRMKVKFLFRPTDGRKVMQIINHPEYGTISLFVEDNNINRRIIQHLDLDMLDLSAIINMQIDETHPEYFGVKYEFLAASPNDYKLLKEFQESLKLSYEIEDRNPF
jgi:hypothetical protein